MLGINAEIRNSLIEIRGNQQEIQNLTNLIFTYFGMELIHKSQEELCGPVSFHQGGKFGVSVPF